METKEWGKFLKPVTLPRFISLINSHKVYLSEIIKLLSPNDKILGIGCGTAVDEIYLSHLGYRVKAIDISEEVLKLARLNNDYFHGQVDFLLADILKLPFGDNEFMVCFSQGVLEHFSVASIKATLKEQLRVAQRVVFSVPSVNWRGRPFGNENFLPLKKWLAMIKDFHLLDCGGYGFGRFGRIIDKINKVFFRNKFKKIVAKFWAQNFYFVITSKYENRP